MCKLFELRHPPLQILSESDFYFCSLTGGAVFSEVLRSCHSPNSMQLHNYPKCSILCGVGKSTVVKSALRTSVTAKKIRNIMRKIVKTNPSKLLKKVFAISII